MNSSKLVRLSLALIICIFSIPSSANIGEITVNGQIIPDVLFKGYFIHRMTDENRCAPTSDTYNRDRVIRLALVVVDGDKRGLTVGESARKNIAKFEQELKYLADSDDDEKIAQTEYIKYSFQYGGYIDHYPAVVTHDDIIEEYKRLVKAKDPRLTDVVVVRHIPMEFFSEDEAREGREMLENGSSVSTVIEKFRNGYFSAHFADFWIPIYDVKLYEGDGKELEEGSVVHIDALNSIYFEEVKYRSRLRPYTSYRNNSKYIYEEVQSDVQRNSRLNRDIALWEAADVREDGEPIKMAKSYPACP